MTKTASSTYNDTFTLKNVDYLVEAFFFMGNFEITVSSAAMEAARFVFSSDATEEQRIRVAKSIAVGDWWMKLADINSTIFVNDETLSGIESLIERGVPTNDACADSISFCFWTQRCLTFASDTGITPFTVVDTYNWFQKLKKSIEIPQYEDMLMFYMYLHFCAINLRLTADHIFTVYNGSAEKIAEFLKVVTSTRFDPSVSEHIYNSSEAALDELVNIRRSWHLSSEATAESVYKFYSRFPEQKISQIESVFRDLIDPNTVNYERQDAFVNFNSHYLFGPYDDEEQRITAAMIVRYGAITVLRADNMIGSLRLVSKPGLENLIAVAEYLSEGGDDSISVDWIVALHDAKLPARR